MTDISVNKKILLREDEDSEMLEVYVNGSFWKSGNFWDFDFRLELPDLLEELGIEFEQESFEHDCDE